MPATDFLQRNRDTHLDELKEWLRIPSVSANSEHKADTAQAADWLAERMREAGLTAEIIQTGGHPVVLGGLSMCGRPGESHRT